MKLDAKRVQELIIDSLEPRTDPEKTIIAEGVVHTFGFNADKLATHKQEIIDLLNELPDNFKEEVGGGWSFIQACIDKNGNHWGEHHSMEELFCLGIAIGRVKCLMPRAMWGILPGGVPYYTVCKNDQPTVTEKAYRESHTDVEDTHYEDKF